MFRVAFPNATETDEKAEIQWVKENFDLSGNNGSTKDPHTIRLAGTWIDPQLAIEIGKAYSLAALVKSVVDAAPDPNGSYRRSGKNTVPPPPASVVASPLTTPTSTIIAIKAQNSTSKTLPTPSPTSTNPPAKRRKDASPAPAPAATSSIIPSSHTSPPPSASKTAAPAPRRSNRKSKSPAPRTLIPLASVRTPKRSTKKDQALTPSHSELAIVDEEGQTVEDGVMGTELMEQDIMEQKRLITELKLKKAEEEPMVSLKQADDTTMDGSEQASIFSKKREREDEDQPLAFDFKEPEKEERVIATNRRINFNLEPRTKSFAWGVIAFAVGMGAV